MPINESYGELNKGFQRGERIFSNLEYGQGVQNVRNSMYSSAQQNAADSASSFKGFVLRVVPPETVIPTGLLEVLKSHSIVEPVENLVQVYVRIPEIHAILPKPEDENSPSVVDHALCIGPKLGTYKFGDVVSVQFNDVYSTAYGIILVNATVPTPPTVDTDSYVQGTQPVFPMDTATLQRQALIGNQSDYFTALHLVTTPGGTTRFYKFLAGMWEGYEALKPSFLAAGWGASRPKPTFVAYMKTLATAYNLAPWCFFERIWIGESGMKPVGIQSQYLTRAPDPSLVDKAYRPRPCASVGIGQALPKYFYSPKFLNLQTRGPYQAQLKPHYGGHAAAANAAGWGALQWGRKNAETFKYGGHQKGGIMYNLVAGWTNIPNVTKCEQRYKQSVDYCKRKENLTEPQILAAFKKAGKSASFLKNVITAWKLTGGVDLKAAQGSFKDHKDYKILCKKKPTKDIILKHKNVKTKCTSLASWWWLCKSKEEFKNKYGSKYPTGCR